VKQVKLKKVSIDYEKSKKARFIIGVFRIIVNQNEEEEKLMEIFALENFFFSSHK
jgi:hypothetical protein